MNTTAHLFRVGALIALITAVMCPAEAAAESAGPVFDIETLRPLLRGTWDWRLPKGDSNGATDVIVSFDDNANVIGTARVIDGGGLVVSPNVAPVRIVIVQSATTGLKSPERGTLLVLPLPGIQIKPARLLLKSASAKKIECIDLAATDRPVRANFVKTSDRFLHEIAGPPSNPVSAVPPAPPPPIESPAASPPAPGPAVVKRAPNPYPAMSVFQRLKIAQTEKEADAQATPAPPRPTPPLKYVPEFKSRPSNSVFQKLKEVQSTKPPESKAQTAAQPPSSPYKILQTPPRRPLSVYERLKSKLQEKNGEAKKTPEQDKTPSAADQPPRPKSP